MTEAAWPLVLTVVVGADKDDDDEVASVLLGLALLAT